MTMNTETPTIKILVCYHKKFPLLKDEIYTPIHVGRARVTEETDTSRWLFNNMIGDDTGENISDRNAYYNEMTALYWAWKNYDKLGNPDYIGLSHYRRHFVMQEGVGDEYYVKLYDDNSHVFDVMEYSPEKLCGIVKGCDFITHIGHVNNMLRHYKENQKASDIDCALEILKEKFPEYAETADAYMQGSEGNFYNMNIFSRELFFQYAEFIFPILEEFEQRNPDVRKRRMFVSERLTAIFVAKLMQDKKLKFKELPTVFIDEPTDVNVAVQVNEDSPSSAAVTIQSIVDNVDGYHHYHFYLLTTKNNEGNHMFEQMSLIISSHKNCTSQQIFCEGKPEIFLSELPERLPTVSKLLCITSETVAIKNIAEFFRLCCVDDFYVSSITENGSMDARFHPALFMVNCKRIKSEAPSPEQLINISNSLPDEVGTIPHQWYISENLDTGYGDVYGTRPRGDLIREAYWRTFIIYDELDPFINFQGIYSSFWWKYYQELPFSLQKRRFDGKELFSLLQKQEIEIENHGKPEQNTQMLTSSSEEWRSYGFWGKLRFYYSHNGFRQTCRYAVYKLSTIGKKK